MALTKQFSGNLFDKDGVAIDEIRFRGFHQPTGIWSEWYDSTSEVQYNCNLGDAQWLTQTGLTAVGDTILIMFETKEVDPLLRQFCLYEFDLTAESTYVQDVQLMLCQPPNVTDLWSIVSGVDGSDVFNTDVHIGRVDDTITATTNFNDNYYWNFSGVELKHVSYALGEDIFEDRLSVDAIYFDWVEDGVWLDGVGSDQHTYTAISPADPGYYTVSVKGVNQKGQEVIDTKKIQIRYNTPIPDIIWSPDAPNVDEVFTLTGNNTDVNSRVTSIEYKFDDITVVTNSVLDHNWIQDLGTEYQSSYTANSDITWNDGFSVLTIVHQETINMANLAPTFTLSQEVMGNPEDNTVKYTLVELNDPDGDNALIAVKWRIEYKTPFDNQFKVVYNPGFPTEINQDPKQWIFTLGGEYRITAIAKDSFNLETEVFVDTVFVSGTDCTGTGSICLNNDAWQLVAVPVEDKTIGDYFIAKIDTLIKSYDPALSASDVVEVCSAYPGHVDKFLSYIPDFTNHSSEHNFSLVMTDSGGIKEITGFWIKVKNYLPLTSNEELFVDWDQKD